MAACYKCDKPLPDTRPGRSDTCESCSAYVRCCRNCRHFHAPNDCREPQAEWVPDRQIANFCDFFVLAPTPASSAASEKPQGDPFGDLFKK